MTDQVNPYGEGIPRVTNLVKKVCGEIPDDWLKWCKENDFATNKTINTDKIVEWASEFGTKMHGICLERHKHQPDSLEATALEHFTAWKDKHLPARMKVEQIVIHPDELYGGTVDMICRITGKRSIVDLKFWGWWKLVFGYKPSKEIAPSNKMVKVNLQTQLYDETQPLDHDRYCLIIHPDGYLFHLFKRKSIKLTEALKIAQKMKDGEVEETVETKSITDF